MFSVHCEQCTLNNEQLLMRMLDTSITINRVNTYIADSVEMMYFTNPDFPDSIWNVTSVVLAAVAIFGIVSNLIIVAAFIRNNSVSTRINTLMMI